MRFLVLSALLSVMPIYSACGDEEDELTEGTPAEPGDSDLGGGSGTSYTPQLVGRTLCYYSSSINHEHQDYLHLELTFKSYSTYSIRRYGSYWKWNNGAYREFYFDETRTGNYTVKGQIITMKGNYPFYNGDRWDKYDWELEYHGNYCTNVDEYEQADIWSFII